MRASIWLLCVATVGGACAAQPAAPRPSPSTPAASTMPASTSAAPPASPGVAKTSAGAGPLASDPQEPELAAISALATADDPPGRAPAYCPRTAPPVERDASCSVERGREELADAVALPSPLPTTRDKCESAWSAEFDHAHRGQLPRAELQKRDGKLAKLEACAGLDASLVRLSRAMLWPECADSLAGATTEVTVTLRGYALAAKLMRWEVKAPSQLAALSKTKGFDAAVAAVGTWMKGEAEMLRRAERAVATLPAESHGRAAAELCTNPCNARCPSRTTPSTPLR